MSTARFRPTRAGIVGLWDYSQAEFAFADGRLVLRGANGSGKTKALEVLFPFVLDGRLDPRRLDPFSGENRTMKDNLLWRGADTGHGFAWLEFGDGAAWVTVAIGLQAQRHRPAARSFFFVTDRRIGHDLLLVDPDGRPRTKRQLTDDLGDGVVVERASEHRQRVDTALFGLGPERYEAMLDLVLTLRRPMLAKDLDPQLLSDTLTRGLRPLDEELLGQVARSFDDLEAVQRDLDRLVAAHDAALAFVTDYRGYLRTQARHRADLTLAAIAAQSDARDRATAAEGALDEARATESLTDAELSDTRDAIERERARRDALQASDAFRAAGQLRHLERAVRDLEEARRRAGATVDQATAALERAAERHDAATQQAAAADTEVARLTPLVLAGAETAGVELAPQDLHRATDDVGVLLRGRVTARRADIDVVREVLDLVDEAEREVAAAERALAAATDANEVAVEALATADTGVDAARADLRAALVAWGAASDVVEESDVTALVAGVVDGDGSGSSPADVWRAIVTGRREQAATERATVAAAQVELERQRAVIDERRRAVLDERDDAPPAAPWHGSDRHDRSGAPLWQLVRFADDVDDARAAGLEAALEASGLLAAWVRPDGSVDTGATDAFLVGRDAEVVGATLADVLVPEDGTDVPAPVLTRLLASIALQDAAGTRTAPSESRSPQGDTALGVDGTYRLGALAGRHRVDAPRYVGATVRAAHRRARIAALDEELAALQRELDGVARELQAIDAWLTAVDDATATLPSSAALRDAARARDVAAGRLPEAAAAVTAATAAADATRRMRNERQQQLRRAAHERGVPAARAELLELARALEQLALDGAELVAALERLALLTAAAEDAATRRSEVADEVARAEDDHRARAREHEARAVELTTLRDRAGDDASRVLADLEATERAITAGEQALRRLGDALRDAAARRGQAEGELTAATANAHASDGAVARAAARLHLLARPDIADPLDLGVHPEVDAEELLATVDRLVAGVSGSEERRKAARTRLMGAYEELDRALGGGFRPRLDVEDDVIVVTVTDDAGERSVAAFAAQLGREREEGLTLLSERERAVFEDTLLTAICRQIHERTRTTRDLVARMDAEMRARRLSSGQTVGVAWRPDDTASPEWTRVHRLLDQDPAHLGAQELEALRAHFSAEIATARAEDPQSPYRDLLARVLDYRRWRRFELSLVEADGSQAQLTRARHARLSGGEKAASLHLPLFAAAHAAFAAGSPTCPRLLGLDEAFAGIDDRGRSELLSLTVAFDLDLFMTGYDLWAVDSSIPGVAHYDLLHLVDANTVSSLLVLWNGRELVEGPDAELELANLSART